MSVEELLDSYDFNLRHGFTNNAEKYKAQILAALKAGQAMRDMFACDTDLEPTFYSKRLKAWDAATKGEV